MATLNTVLKLKRSKIPGNVPDASLLDSGELAINTADGILYYKDASNEVKKLSDSDLIASTYLALSGGTMSGTINMGNNDIIIAHLMTILHNVKNCLITCFLIRRVILK